MNWVKYHSEKEKQKRSEKASKAADARWEAYHVCITAQTYEPVIPTDCFRITVDNLVSSNSHVMLFHPGSRRGRYQIDVDGTFWKECGWSDAMVRIRKSCKRSPL